MSGAFLLWIKTFSIGGVLFRSPLNSFTHPFSWAWSNLLSSHILSFASSLDEVQRVLKSAGFSQVKSIGQLEGQTFCRDPHCGDMLVLPAQLKAQLYSTKLLGDHKLIIQVQAALRESRFLTRAAFSLEIVEICWTPSIFPDIYDFILVIDLLKLIGRMRSLMPTKISLPR